MPCRCPDPDGHAAAGAYLASSVTNRGIVNMAAIAATEALARPYLMGGHYLYICQ